MSKLNKIKIEINSLEDKINQFKEKFNDLQKKYDEEQELQGEAYKKECIDIYKKATKEMRKLRVIKNKHKNTILKLEMKLSKLELKHEAIYNGRC